jgi:hypothetical protein
MVERLVQSLEADPPSHLTPNELAHLLVLIQTTLEVSSLPFSMFSSPDTNHSCHLIKIDEQRRALDPNGLRYLISMRSFYILNNRASTASGSGTAKITDRRERLRYRDMIWAFHSESQDLLLSASTSACTNGKMCWSDARALGVSIWLKSVESLVRMQGLIPAHSTHSEHRKHK